MRRISCSCSGNGGERWDLYRIFPLYSGAVADNTARVEEGVGGC